MSDAEPGDVVARAPRPLWWWFLLHGVIIAVWGAFALVSPMAGAPGWIFDGIAYGVMLVLAGTQLVLQGWSGRHGPGWRGLVLAGAVAAAFGLGVVVAGGFGGADALFWIVVVFLVVESPLLIGGTFRDPVYRRWGLLMGGVLALGVVVLVVVYLVFGGDFDVLDPVLGSLALLYGIALIVAATQARETGLTRDPDAE